MSQAAVTVYYAQQCPNCTRFLKSAQRLNIEVTLVDVARTPVRGLTAVPTVVVRGQGTMVGTKAFEWLQTFESRMPLTSYATVLGEGTDGGLSYTDLHSDETVASTPFGAF